MELMDKSLTHFLESSTQPIPYHIQVNICHDITLALSFLHSNNIVHRDLSSNNVLLRGNVLAKVTDFGMARPGDINPQATRFTNTMCPGTDVYMPPTDGSGWCVKISAVISTSIVGYYYVSASFSVGSLTLVVVQFHCTPT